MAEEEAPREICFIISPIGSADSPERRHADWVLEGIILPTFQQNFPSFDVVRSDRISLPGQIDRQMFEYIFDSRIVIADLTFLNPNVFYELGIRHMEQKPAIHMHLAGQKIPFDIAQSRSIEFSLDSPAQLRAAQALLKASVQEVLMPGYRLSNPVTQVRGEIRIERSATPADKALLNKLENLERRVAALEPTAPSTALDRRLISQRPRIQMKLESIESEGVEAIVEGLSAIIGKPILSYQVEPKEKTLLVPVPDDHRDPLTLARLSKALPGVTSAAFVVR